MNLKSLYEKIVARLNLKSEDDDTTEQSPPVVMAKSFAPPGKGRPKDRRGGGVR